MKTMTVDTSKSSMFSPTNLRKTLDWNSICSVRPKLFENQLSQFLVSVASVQFLEYWSSLTSSSLRLLHLGFVEASSIENVLNIVQQCVINNPQSRLEELTIDFHSPACANFSDHWDKISTSLKKLLDSSRNQNFQDFTLRLNTTLTGKHKSVNVAENLTDISKSFQASSLGRMCLQLPCVVRIDKVSLQNCYMNHDEENKQLTIVFRKD